MGDNSVPQGNLYAIRPPLVAAIGLNQERVGEVVWNVTIPAGLAAPPLGVDGGVVVQANSGTYRLLSRIDGRTIWAKVHISHDLIKLIRLEPPSDTQRGVR